MEKEDNADKEKVCVFEAGWGRVFYGESMGLCTAEFWIEDERIAVGDVQLVWRVIEDLVDGSRVGPLIDEKVCESDEPIAFSLSFKKRLKTECSKLFLDWMMNGEADSLIEMGLEFVIKHRAKAVELSLLQGFHHLHPEQIRSMALGIGDNTTYVDQLRFFGMDVEAWPMAVIPTCLIKTGPRIGKVYAEHAQAKPLVLTRWGWITLEEGVVNSVSPKRGVIVAVSIYESVPVVEDSFWGVNLDADFSAWHKHFTQSFPRIGEHVEIVESDRCWQTFGLALAPQREKEGWAELMAWLRTGALDREIDRFATASNFSPAQLDRYFELVDYPADERQKTKSLCNSLFEGQNNGH